VFALLCEGKVRAIRGKIGDGKTSKWRPASLRKWLTNPEDAGLIEMLDRVLDHGIVVDPSSRVRLPGLELHKEQEMLVIDWRDTYF
jgi:hypothetical protein